MSACFIQWTSAQFPEFLLFIQSCERYVSWVPFPYQRPCSTLSLLKLWLNSGLIPNHEMKLTYFNSLMIRSPWRLTSNTLEKGPLSSIVTLSPLSPSKTSMLPRTKPSKTSASSTKNSYWGYLNLEKIKHFLWSWYTVQCAKDWGPYKHACAHCTCRF